jgi:hypothetical protein
MENHAFHATIQFYWVGRSGLAAGKYGPPNRICSVCDSSATFFEFRTITVPFCPAAYALGHDFPVVTCR